jgi:tetratricopeptide (TPR) repeat protein
LAASAWLGAAPADRTLEEKKAIAMTQHDLLVLLIDKGQFDQVQTEFQKILDLKFADKQEKYVVDEILILSEMLFKKGQSKLALQLADMGLGALREKESRARLFKEKGFIYKQLGQAEKAMEMFEKGRALEATPPAK